jgi:hypothetical protein
VLEKPEREAGMISEVEVAEFLNKTGVVSTNLPKVMCDFYPMFWANARPSLRRL